MLRNEASFNYIIAWVGGFSFFAFLTTLIREVIKDAEDLEGDMAYGMKTVPIILGAFWTKMVLGILIGLALFMLVFLLVKFILFSVEPADYISLIYFGLFLIFPLLTLLYLVIQAKDKRGFGKASMLIKIVMLTGILYTVLVFYLVNFKY